MSPPDTIVVHHAAAPRSTTVEQIRDWHTGKSWRDIGYHWLITQPGEVASLHMGRKHDLDDEWEPWEYGAHAKGHNSHSIGICLVGNYDEEEVPPETLEVLHGWLVALCLRWGLTSEAIRSHGELTGAATACPGRFVDMGEVRARVRHALDGSPPVYRCRTCGARWRKFGGMVSLWPTDEAEPCCDNVDVPLSEMDRVA